MANDTDLTQQGTGRISQSGTGSNTLKAITMVNNTDLTVLGTGKINFGGDGTSIRSGRPTYICMDALEEINYFSGRVGANLIKSITFDITTCDAVATTTITQNTVMFGLVKLINGEMYTGVYFYSSSAGITFQAALYGSGLSAPRFALQTTNYTSVAGHNFMPFAATYTSPLTQFAYIALVPTSVAGYTPYVVNTGITNWGRTATDSTLNLISATFVGSYISGSTFANPFAGRISPSTNKFYFGIY